MRAYKLTEAEICDRDEARNFIDVQMLSCHRYTCTACEVSMFFVLGTFIH